MIQYSICTDRTVGEPMTILVLSDSHAALSFMRRLVDTIKPQAAIHLGDFYEDAQALQEDYIYSETKLYEGISFPLTVSEGCLFVLGDNRMDSKDSRSPEIGLIDKREVLGKAVFLFYPGDPDDNGPAKRDLGRIGGLY